MALDDYLSLLNPEQMDAVVHEGKSLLILAGAGSGKTRVITTKIAWLISQRGIDPKSILAVTFTKKAANEMRERAIRMDERAFKTQIKTFHSFGAWFLRHYAKDAGISENFTVYDDEDCATLIKNAVPSLTAKTAKQAAHEISLAKDYFLTPEDDLSILASDLDINSIYAAYENRLRATGNVDFGDLIMLPVFTMQKNERIRNNIHKHFKVILVDEYQDSNIAQYKLLEALSGVSEGNDCYVCAVGDDDQSIYAFRGAEVKNILNFSKTFPNTDIIKLERNYRSTKEILDCASIAVSRNQNRLGKTLVSERGEGKKPVLAFLPNQEAEALFVADLISQSVEAGRGTFSDWCITYRTNAQSRIFEKEFLHRQIPYKVVGSLKFLEREEVKDVIAYMSLLANPKDEVSFRRIVNKPVRGIGLKSQDKIVSMALMEMENDDDGNVDYIEVTRTVSVSFTKKAHEGAEEFIKQMESLRNCFVQEEKLSYLMKKIIAITGLDEYYREEDKAEGTQKVQNLEELVNAGIPYDCSIEGLNSFLDDVNLDRSIGENQNDEDNQNSVTLITLHNTKGLEFPKVVITGLEEGTFPRRDKYGDELEEERRLFYVGITRAMDELYVTSCAMRALFGRTEVMDPSIFIKESQSGFKIIGQKPFSFSSSNAKIGYGEDGGGTYVQTREEFGEKLEYAEKWKKGTRVYSDDFGYGSVTDRYLNEGEFVIKVQFETGTKKTYLPEYQINALMIVKD